MGLPKWLTSKESTCQGGRRRRHGFDPWVRKIPWRRKWQPTPVLLPGESNGQRSLADFRPWGHKRNWTWLSDYTTTITHGSRNTCFPPRASVPGWEPVHRHTRGLYSTSELVLASGDNVRCDTSCIRPPLWASLKPQTHSCHWSQKFHSCPGVQRS